MPRPALGRSPYLYTWSIMTLFNNDPHDYLCDTYDMDTLKDVANYGCISGCATRHITYTQTSEFFDQYQERISDDYELIFDEPIVKAAVNAGMTDIISIKNWCTWWFIEEYAQLAVLADEELVAA